MIDQKVGNLSEKTHLLEGYPVARRDSQGGVIDIQKHRNRYNNGTALELRGGTS